MLGLLLANTTRAQITADILVVGAGGGGGAHQQALANTGGGGGGGVVYVTGTTLSSGTYTVTIAPTTQGQKNTSSSCWGFGYDGANSTFSIVNGINITAYGGGGGGGCGTANGKPGGSGGGGHCGGTGGTATKGICSGNIGGVVTTYGSNGGNTAASCSSAGAGGGGASAAGSVSNGGQGVSISISGTTQVYGSGGGGNAATGGAGGTNAGCGASGTSTTGNGGNINATNNFGGGGGATSCGDCTSGTGGSGVVILSYASTTSRITNVNGGGGQATCTTTTYTGNGTIGANGVVYQVHTFTGSGTFEIVSAITAHPSTTDQNVCVNGTATALSVTASGSGQTFQWYRNTTASNSGGTLISGATTASYTPPTATAGRTYYYCYVTTTNNGNAFSNVSGAINVGSVAGTVSGGTTVTSATNSTTLTATGSVGSLQWQSSTDNATFTDISGATNTTHTATNVTQTTNYRVRATNGSCGSVFSPSATILYQAPPTSGTTAAITASNGTTPATNNTPTLIDPNITVTSNGNLTGLSVSITSNYTAGDELAFTGSLPAGVTAAQFNPTSRSLVFSGSASAADWQNLLRRVQIKTTSATCNPESRQITFSASTNYYNYFNGHFYEYSPTIRTWTAAKAYAESQSFFGRKGYLVTVSSAAENAFIYSLINYDTWIGCSDNFSQINSAVGFTKYANQSAAEGRWHWITGPEKGVQIRTGNATGAENAGAPVTGIYQNWNLGGSYANNEPNDVWSFGTPGQEDYGHLWGNSGKWNDFPNNGRACIVEYGDMPGDNPVSTLATTKNISVSAPAPGSVSGGGGSLCSATNSTTLTYNNPVGNTNTIVRWESSPDNFLATTTQIASTNSTYAATNLTATTSFRVVVVNGSCTTLTAPVTITYAQIVNPGTIVSNNATICENTSARLSLSGCPGTVTKWQRKTGAGGTYADIASSASTELTNTISTAGTYFFKAFVTNGAGCSAVETPEYTITVSAATTPAGGEVSSNAHCGVNNNGTLVLSGAAGSSYSWEVSTDNGSTWSSASNTTTTFNYTNVSQNRLYRVLVSDGACGSSYSTIGSITIYGTTKCLFTGASSGNWGSSANWCGGVIADNGSDVDISPTCRFDIELDKNRTVGQLNFLFGSKYVRLGNFNLTASSITGHDSLNHIKITGTGTLKMELVHGAQKTFPIGRNTYNPVTITNKTNQTDVFTTSLLDEVYGKGTCCVPLTRPRVTKTWIIDKVSGTSNSGDGVDFTFNWYSNERSGTINTYRMYHFNGSNWDKITPASSAVDETSFYTHNGYKGSFSPFAIGDDLVLLPVTWQGLSCAREGSMGARISWSTANEYKSDSFIVERATTAGEFRRIGALAAAGNSQTTSKYNLLDEQAPSGTLFYRVRLTDMDGNRTYSEICEVSNSKALPVVKIFPNPADNNIYVLLSDAAELPATIAVTDITGKEVLHRQAATAQTKISSAHLPAGMYMIQIQSQGKPMLSQKILIQH